MPSDKYTKDFSDFGAYTFQGQITPNMFDHTGAGGDGQPGLQEMTQAALSAYGPRHIIEGLEVAWGGGNDTITGTTGYYMWDGKVYYTTGQSGTIAAEEYAVMTTGGLEMCPNRAAASGVALGMSGTVMVDISQRWVFDKQANIYVDRINVFQITGTNAKITNATQDIDFGGAYTLTSLVSGDANGEPIRYNEFKSHETDYLLTSGDYVGVSGNYNSHNHDGVGEGATIDHVDLDNKGSNTHATIDTHIANIDQHAPIQAMLSAGFLGFVLTETTYGAPFAVACSDAEATMYWTFHVEEIGTYRLHIYSSCSNAGVNCDVGGQLSVGRAHHGSPMNWNEASATSITLEQSDTANVLQNYEFATHIETSSIEGMVHVRLLKNNNMNGRNGSLYIWGACLERIA